MTSEQYNKSVHLYADRLFRFVLKNIRSEADAKDIVQQSFEKVWRKHEDISFAKVRSYLFTVAHHTLIDHIRKNKRIDVVEQTPEKKERGHYDQFELKDSLNRAISQLNDIQKKVILLRDYEGYSYKEIADITELSEAQVKVYIFRGRKKLQKILTQLEKVI